MENYLINNGFPTSSANFIFVDGVWTSWDGQVRNLIWNPVTLAWEAATGSIAGGLAASINNFPATYPVTGALTDSELRSTPVEVYLDGGVVETNEVDYTIRLDTVDTITYIGKALVGSLETESLWQIKRVDESNGIIILFANGSTDFDSKWSEHLLLSYS